MTTVAVKALCFYALMALTAGAAQVPCSAVDPLAHGDDSELIIPWNVTCSASETARIPAHRTSETSFISVLFEDQLAPSHRDGLLLAASRDPGEAETLQAPNTADEYRGIALATTGPSEYALQDPAVIEAVSASQFADISTFSVYLYSRLLGVDLEKPDSAFSDPAFFDDPIEQASLRLDASLRLALWALSILVTASVTAAVMGRKRLGA